MAAITRVYTVALVAQILDEDEDWLHELIIDMDPEDGCLTVYGLEEDGVTALTDDGIDNLRDLIADLRLDGRAPGPL
jgi:hypothetical protein